MHPTLSKDIKPGSSNLSRQLLSVVVPVYNGEPFLEGLVSRTKYTVAPLNIDLEIILVDDCGPDESWPKIRQLANNNQEVRGIQLSRNFGQHKAITAGLSIAKGEYIVVMDCDLQDQPEEISNLYRKAREGYDVVFARRHDRKDRYLKKLFSRAFYLILGYLTETKQDPAIANFGIYQRKVINAVLSMPDSFRCFPVMVRWVGFRTVAIDVAHAKRSVGKSAYNFGRSLRLATDTILAFSDKPLRLTVKLGGGLALSACMAALVTFIMALNKAFSQAGWASIIVSIWFFSGLVIMLLGCVGLYVGKNFEQAKNRPVFFIREGT